MSTGALYTIDYMNFYFLYSVFNILVQNNVMTIYLDALFSEDINLQF